MTAITTDPDIEMLYRQNERQLENTRNQTILDYIGEKGYRGDVARIVQDSQKRLGYHSNPIFEFATIAADLSSAPAQNVEKMKSYLHGKTTLNHVERVYISQILRSSYNRFVQEPAANRRTEIIEEKRAVVLENLLLSPRLSDDEKARIRVARDRISPQAKSNAVYRKEAIMYFEKVSEIMPYLEDPAKRGLLDSSTRSDIQSIYEDNLRKAKENHAKIKKTDIREPTKLAEEIINLRKEHVDHYVGFKVMSENAQREIQLNHVKNGEYIMNLDKGGIGEFITSDVMDEKRPATKLEAVKFEDRKEKTRWERFNDRYLAPVIGAAAIAAALALTYCAYIAGRDDTVKQIKAQSSQVSRDSSSRTNLERTVGGPLPATQPSDTLESLTAKYNATENARKAAEKRADALKADDDADKAKIAELALKNKTYENQLAQANRRTGLTQDQKQKLSAYEVAEQERKAEEKRQRKEFNDVHILVSSTSLEQITRSFPLVTGKFYSNGEQIGTDMQTGEFTGDRKAMYSHNGLLQVASKIEEIYPEEVSSTAFEDLIESTISGEDQDKNRAQAREIARSIGDNDQSPTKFDKLAGFTLELKQNGVVRTQVGDTWIITAPKDAYFNWKMNGGDFK